jgi:anaerobic selenocysteine-containing dehydrogenase
VTVGSDLLGMLGIAGREILAAGAAFPNRSTEAAEFVMPAAIAMELGGMYLLGGERQVCLEAVLPPPAGVLAPADVIGSIARAGGAEAPGPTTAVGALSRLAAAAPSIPAGFAAAAASPVLMLGRQAADAGCGELTAHASWQSAVGSPPSVRLAAADARRIGVKDLDMVEVRTGELSVRARVRINHALDAGAVVLPEALREARAMCPLHVSPATEAVVASPGTVNIEAANDYASQTA